MDRDELLTKILQENQERDIYGLLDSKLLLHGDVLETVVLDGNEYLLLLEYSHGSRDRYGYVLTKSDPSFVVTVHFDGCGKFHVIQQEDIEEGIVECDDGRRWEGMSCNNVVSGDRCPYGMCEYYDEEGTLSFVGVLTERSMCGYGVEYYGNGKLKSECVCIHGNRFGLAKEYDRNGAYVHHTLYIMNKAYFFLDGADGWSSRRLVNDPSFTTLADSLDFISSVNNEEGLFLSLFPFIEHASITDTPNSCFVYVEIAYMPRLIDVSFGEYSFCLDDPSMHLFSNGELYRNTYASLLIHDCRSLESVSFGVYAFSSFFYINFSSMCVIVC